MGLTLNIDSCVTVDVEPHSQMTESHRSKPASLTTIAQQVCPRPWGSQVIINQETWFWCQDLTVAVCQSRGRIFRFREFPNPIKRQRVLVQVLFKFQVQRLRTLRTHSMRQQHQILMLLMGITFPVLSTPRFPDRWEENQWPQLIHIVVWGEPLAHDTCDKVYRSQKEAPNVEKWSLEDANLLTKMASRAKLWVVGSWRCYTRQEALGEPRNTETTSMIPF